MCGLFHRVPLLYFYRTSGRTFHKYNSSIAPIELVPAVKNLPAMSKAPYLWLTPSLLADLGYPIACISQCRLTPLALSIALLDIPSTAMSGTDESSFTAFRHVARSIHPLGCCVYAPLTDGMSKFIQPANPSIILGSLQMTRPTSVAR